MPFWVKLSCAVAIALGTYLGGWRIIRTLGKGLVEIAAPQGMAAESSSAAIILTSSHLGLPLSTTHVATGRSSVPDSGAGAPRSAGAWPTDGRRVADHPAVRRHRRCRLLGVGPRHRRSPGRARRLSPSSWPCRSSCTCARAVSRSIPPTSTPSGRTDSSPRRTRSPRHPLARPTPTPPPAATTERRRPMDLLTQTANSLWQVVLVGLLLGGPARDLRAGLKSLSVVPERTPTAPRLRAPPARSAQRHASPSC